jgi:hypothetical protein
MLRFTVSRVRALLFGVAALLPLAMFSAAPAHAQQSLPDPYTVDTGWVNYDGGCQAHTQLHYSGSTNTLQMKTDVKDPYLFVACRVAVTAILDEGAYDPQNGNRTRNPLPHFPGGAVNANPVQSMMACAVLDPSCASTTYGGWQTIDPGASLDAFWNNFGDPSTVVNDIRIQQVKG